MRLKSTKWRIVNRPMDVVHYDVNGRGCQNKIGRGRDDSKFLQQRPSLKIQLMRHLINNATLAQADRKTIA